MRWFSQMRGLVYLKRISDSLERIAEVAERSTGVKPRRSKRSMPNAEVFSASVEDWNQRYREDHPEMEFLDRNEV